MLLVAVVGLLLLLPRRCLRRTRDLPLRVRDQPLAVLCERHAQLLSLVLSAEQGVVVGSIGLMVGVRLGDLAHKDSLTQAKPGSPDGAVWIRCVKRLPHPVVVWHYPNPRIGDASNPSTG